MIPFVEIPVENISWYLLYVFKINDVVITTNIRFNRTARRLQGNAARYPKEEA